MLTRASTAFSNIWGAADGDKDTQCRDTDTSCAEYSANDGCNTHEEWMNVRFESCVSARL